MLSQRNLFMAVLFLAAAPVGAQTGNLPVGSVAASWLNLAGSARIEGMGEAAVALADHVDSLGVNPAGLGRLQAPELSLTHDSYIQGADIEQVMGSFGLGQGNLAVGFTYGNFGTVQAFTVSAGTPAAAGSFQPSVWRLDMGYGFALGSDFFAGIVGKLFMDDLDGNQATGGAGDIGALWIPAGSGLNLGLSVLNIGALAGEAIPTEARGGAAYLLSIPNGTNTPADQFTLSLDGLAQIKDINAARVALGAEYWYHQAIALRVGQQLMDTTGLSGWSGFSAGIGVRFSGVQLDYAFATRGDLGNLNIFSLLAAL
jgi:hypothetical protein